MYALMDSTVPAAFVYEDMPYRSALGVDLEEHLKQPSVTDGDVELSALRDGATRICGAWADAELVVQGVGLRPCQGGEDDKVDQHSDQSTPKGVSHDERKST